MPAAFVFRSFQQAVTCSGTSAQRPNRERAGKSVRAGQLYANATGCDAGLLRHENLRSTRGSQVGVARGGHTLKQQSYGDDILMVYRKGIGSTWPQRRTRREHWYELTQGTH
jgi:hypothetical protein